MVQLLAGIGEKVAQQIGGVGQASQFVVALVDQALANLAAAKLFDMAGECADRHQQVAIDQGQATNGHHDGRPNQNKDATENGAAGTAGNRHGFGLGVLVQLFDQGGHLFAGGAVDAFDCGIAGFAVRIGGNKCGAALAIGLAEAAVLIF